MRFREGLTLCKHDFWPTWVLMKSQFSINSTSLPWPRDEALPCSALYIGWQREKDQRSSRSFRKIPHSKALHDPRNDSNASITRRSALGLVAIYNLLPFLVQKTFLLSREARRDASSSSHWQGTHNGRSCFLLASRLFRTLSWSIRKSWRPRYNAVCAYLSFAWWF